jgi:hypothetical protein
MEVLLIELVLWGGLLFFFWALKDGLGRVESDMESLGLLNTPHKYADAKKRFGYVHPDKVAELIGSYGDAPIYRYAYVDGQCFQFDHARPVNAGWLLKDGELCLEPGLVYVRCDNRLPAPA